MTQVGPTTCDTCGKIKPHISEWKEFEPWMSLCVTGELVQDFCSYACLHESLRDKIDKKINGAKQK